MVQAADVAGLRSGVTSLLQDMQRLGMQVMRMWAFCDGDAWHALQPSQGVYNETIFS